MSILGVVIATQFSIEHDLKMSPGDRESIAGYEFELVEHVSVRGPNYLAEEGRVVVRKNGKIVARMNPQKRQYMAQGNMMTEASIDGGLFRDLYVAMGEPIGDHGAWAMRLHYKPMVRWIWLGAIFMALGGFITVTDKRYRRAAVKVNGDASAKLAVPTLEAGRV